MRSAHFIDLDIILDMKTKPWIVSKDNPNIPIMKIEPYQFKSFKSGIFRSHNNKISFNGENFWLPNDFMNKLKIKSKKYKQDISNLAISMQEYLNPSIIEKIDSEIDMEVFNNMVNTDDDIYIICGKNKKKYYQKHLDKIEEELNSIGLKVKDYYFLSETFYNKDKDDIAYKKVKLLLQHLIGLKTQNDKITAEEITDYEKVYFYDDDKKSIELTKNINTLLENLLLKSEKEVKMIVKDKIRNAENLVVCKFYTHNKSNKFEETLIPLEFSNVIKTFENFNFDPLKKDFSDFSKPFKSIFNPLEKIKEGIKVDELEDDIDLIKTIFTYLTDEWGDMEEGQFLHTKKRSKEIKYTFITKNNIRHLTHLPEPNTYRGRYPLFKVRSSATNYTWIDNLNKIFFAIYIDLTGPNDMFSVLYDFNKDCENLVQQYNNYFNTELITGYGTNSSTPSFNNRLARQSNFLIVFYDE